MAEFKLSRIRYNWRNTWVTATAYKRDDIVRVGSKSYVCLEGHTSSALFTTDGSYWTVMTSGANWRSTWAATTLYNVGDLVYYSGIVYYCAVSHTSASLFDTNIDNWTTYSGSNEWNSSWQQNTRYGIGDLVKYNGIVYRCIAGHTSSTTANGLEIGNNDEYQDSTTETWEVYSSGIEYRGDWDNAIRYRANDLVKFGGTVWKCTTGHTSGDDSTLNFNDELFTIELSGQQYRGEWDSTAPYYIGDVVIYGGYLYVCIRNDINEIPPTQTDAWSVVTKNYNLTGDWSKTTNYLTGDTVRRGGQLYVATADAPGQTATTIAFDVTIVGPASVDTGNKYALDGQYRFQPEFVVGNTYVFNQNDPTNLYYPNANGTTFNTHPISFSANDPDGPLGAGTTYLNGVVYKLDELEVSRADYIANFSEADTRTVSITVTESTPALWYYCENHLGMGSTISIDPETVGIDPSISASWTRIVSGEKWAGGWQNNTRYAVGDLVTYYNVTYKCTVSHVSDSAESYPGNGNGPAYDFWQTYLVGDTSNALAKKGDLLSYGVTVDESSLGAIPVSIGDAGQLLTIAGNDDFNYQTHGKVVNLFYVGPNGVDDVGYGTTQGTPFKTIRYACEIAEQFDGAKKIIVRTGVYEEILPIIVPSFTAIHGEELRSVTVRAAGAVAALSLDSVYTKAVLQRMRDIVSDIIQNNPVDKNPLNTKTQNTLYTAGTAAVGTAVEALIDDITAYIDFYIESTGNDPVMTGTNTARATIGFAEAVQVLEANKEFLAEEATAYMQSTYPSYSFDPALCKRDIRRYIDAWKYDIIYTGNYKSLLAARYYRNAVLGSAGEDMFYLRNSTDLRNMSLEGLTGFLNPPAVFELYQRPTGGAYASLDPGWGPDDDRVWITTRSPYIQNCTTFGDSAIGQKIDGALHNGGNKSMVSNDFTQVISDGIGAWVLNGGRAELVSVFSYYAQIGYFAESGGVIRATNGNSSYGQYGALAQGNDPTETPRYGNVNNRSTDASVLSVLAGDFGDDVLLMEFQNAGQNYTSASYTITGSGTGVSVVQEDFRDNAIFDVHVLDPADSGDRGGAGFITAGNNAQAGDLTTIQLSAADSATESEYLGMRIIITSGVGTGQYGYIHAYDEFTKVVTVYKESTGTPGWDNVLPGLPTANPLYTNTVYRIEPRPIFSDPGYQSSAITLSSTTSWANVTYGETSETFTNVTGTVGSGTTIDITPVTAVWNVTRVGRLYTVTLVNAGAGYADEQTITIDGAAVGGVSEENDIVITVKSVTEDSTNSIVTFEYTGVGISGRFVATASNANSVVYSNDGDLWNNGTGLTTGNWNCLTAGGGRFVAIKNYSATAAYSTDGVNWTESSMPAARYWSGVAYGSGIFVAVESTFNTGAYSSNGISWTTTTMPTIGDSSFNEWTDITYGQGRFVAVAKTGNYVAVGTYSGGTLSWVGHLMDSVADSSQRDWVSIAYGNNRFVAISSTGDISYSFDGNDWYGAAMPTQDGSTAMNWKQIRYGQGVFFAVCDTGSRDIFGDTTTGPTTYAATSTDGITWTPRTLSTEIAWNAVAFGNPDVTLGDSTLTNSKGMWIAVSSDNTAVANKVFTGARAIGRVVVESARIYTVKLWDPGSGYLTEPTLTIIDPNQSSEVFVQNRLGDGVLAQPSFISRGTGYKSSSTTATITGNGFADVIPVGKFVTLNNLVRLPRLGAQFRFGGRSDVYTVVGIREIVQNDGTYQAQFQISPVLVTADDIQHGTEVEIRERYSQCRITGHDFLDIGTGNFTDTNYPTLYSTGLYTSSEENEIFESNGGRVFYTSTDQSGNFRTGELFAVEQATGIVTISADFFDLQGLTELALGGVRLGGSGTVIREFSTDPTFAADSNNVVPTQRAVKSYLQNRLSVGGSDLSVPSFVAGYVRIGPNSISTTTDVFLELPKTMNFGVGASVTGMMLALTRFYSSFNEG
jgi:hypothetical protein